MKNEHNQRETVAAAAQQLDVSEYEIFQRAYRHWHGNPGIVDLEREFGHYLLHAKVPVWVRHFLRHNNVLPEPPLVLGRNIYVRCSVTSVITKRRMRYLADRYSDRVLAA